MKLRVYLDTSVFSARLDTRAPERAGLTETFFEGLNEYEAGTCALARIELQQTPDPKRRADLLNMLSSVQVHAMTEEMYALARRYVDAEVFAVSMVNDALHVAAAVLSRHEVLVSWNFRHLVNRRRRAQINLLNGAFDLPSIEILAPPEL